MCVIVGSIVLVLHLAVHELSIVIVHMPVHLFVIGGSVSTAIVRVIIGVLS